MVSHTAPHTGNEYQALQAPKENVDKFKTSIEDENRRVYAAMVDKLDESVGIIVTALGNKELLNNSIIIFASDNGAAPEGFALNYGSNWPLRGVKNTLWEGGTRVAACIWSPNIQNRVSADLMHSSDWLPTLYEAAGGNPEDLRPIDGVSIWKTLTSGEASPRQEFLYNIDDIYNNSAIRFGSWKLIQGNTSTSDLGGGMWDSWYGFYNQSSTVSELIPQILNSQVTLALESAGFMLNRETVEKLQKMSDIQCNNQIASSCDPYSGPCLFNVDEDPCEQINVAEENQPILRQCLELLNRYNETARKIIDLSYHPEAAPHKWGYVWTNWLDFVEDLSSARK